MDRYYELLPNGEWAERQVDLTCHYCGMPVFGPHMTNDCPGDAPGMQGRIADLERRIEALESAANTRSDDGPSS